MTATITDFMVDGNLVAKSIVGHVIEFKTVGKIDCVVVDLGVWGDFTFPRNYAKLELTIG